MSPRDKDELLDLFNTYGAAEIFDTMAEIYKDLEHKMLDEDWCRECRDSWALMKAIAHAAHKPCPLRETGLFKRVSGLDTE